MIICSKCFKDTELIGIIENLGKKGKCVICQRENVFVYDTEDDSAMADFFDKLISIYTPVTLLRGDYPKHDFKLLTDELINTWNIFNNVSKKQVYDFITNIHKDKYDELPQLFDGPVGIAESQDEDYLKTKSIFRSNSWETFVDNLKTKNRFHRHHINTDILAIFCSYIRKPYRKGEVFYRARLSAKEGYTKDEMGPPPSGKATAGRANSLGISCLYLANKLETTIHEVRAGAFDYISVGKFELQQDIIVVDLKLIDKISPFLEEIDPVQYAINKEVLQKINREIAKPLRKSDSPLEYIPTQYISEFIKSIEYDGKMEYAGIEYGSTMSQDSHNLAIFNSELFKCINVETYWIEKLQYTLM